MINVRQTIFERGKGNCLSACLASVLELPIEEVPSFCNEGEEGSWLLRMGAWLRTHGLGFVNVPWNSEMGALPFNCHPIVMGTTTRSEEHHAVVGCVEIGNTEPTEVDGISRTAWRIIYLWDPHPSGNGLDEIESLLFIVRGAD